MAEACGLTTQTPPSLDNFSISNDYISISPASISISLWSSPPYYAKYITFQSSPGGLAVMPAHTVTVQGASSGITFTGSGYVAIGKATNYYQVSSSTLTSVEFGGVSTHTLSVPEIKFIIEPCSEVYLAFIVTSISGGQSGNKSTISTTASCKVYPFK